MLTLYSSGLPKGARISMMAAVVGIMATGSAMAASCTEVPGWTDQINTYCSPPYNGTGPVCTLPADLALCCGDPSPAEGEEPCLCSALQGLSGGNQNKLVLPLPDGAGVVYSCPPA